MDSLCDWLEDGASAFDFNKHDEDYYTKMKCVRIVTNGVVRCHKLILGENAIIVKPSQLEPWLQRWSYLKASYMVKWTHFSEPGFQVSCLCQQWAYKQNKVSPPVVDYVFIPTVSFVGTRTKRFLTNIKASQ